MNYEKLEEFQRVFDQLKDMTKNEMLGCVTFINFLPELIENKIISKDEIENITTILENEERKQAIINYIRKRLEHYAKTKKS